MKRILLAALMVALLLATGCSKQVPTENPVDDGAVATSAPAEPLEPSLNKTVVTEEKAPKILWKSDIAYHLENCPTLSEGVSVEAKEIPWLVAKEIGLRQCPACNPPRYEGYVEAE